MNIVKKVCEEFNLTQKELSINLDVPLSTLTRWASGDIPKMAELYFKLLLENKELKDKIEAIRGLRDLIQNL